MSRATLTAEQCAVWPDSVEIKPTGRQTAEQTKAAWAFSYRSLCALEGFGVPSEQAVLAGLTPPKKQAHEQADYDRAGDGEYFPHDLAADASLIFGTVLVVLVGHGARATIPPVANSVIAP